MTMKKPTIIAGLALLLGAGIAIQAQDVRQGLVSYWPLDELNPDFITFPDVISGNDVQTDSTIFMTVPGKVGNAVEFDPELETRLWHWNVPGMDSGLPVTEAPNYTMMCWVNATYPYPDENDRRALSTSSSTDDNPLVNIGTHNGGGDSNVDLYIRNGGTQVNHAHGTITAYDGQWRHIALVDVGGELQLYVDGELDSSYPYTRGATPMDITSIGAIVRQASGEPPFASAENIGSWFRGLIDEVMMWERALTQEEIQDVIANGIQTPVPTFAPEIYLQPVGSTGLLVGDAWTLEVAATGSRPMTFQWKKDGANLGGETNPTLELTDMVEADSGAYSVAVSNAAGTVNSDEVQIAVGDWAGPDLQDGLLSYWPMEEVIGTKTPDMRSWYDMELVNLGEGDLVAGRQGMCFQFVANNQTILQRIHNPGDELPIYPHPSWSLSMWVKGLPQSDKRVFSEGSTETTVPLFNIGTHNTAADGTVDTYIRSDANTTQNHQHTVGVAFDDEWHHILYVQRVQAGAPTAVVYVDGVEDPNPPLPVIPLTPNNTAIGGIRRSNPSHWFDGLIDEVAIWTRALSPDEAMLLFNDGMPEVEPRQRPLAVNSFVSDRPAVNQGANVLLSWDVTADADEVRIEPGPGDVTSLTTAGAGSVETAVNGHTTFTLSVIRGGQTVTETLEIGAVNGIEPGWDLVDAFDYYAAGPLRVTGWWLDLRAGGGEVDAVEGNNLVRLSSTEGGLVFPLGPLTVMEGQQATLFYRVQTGPDAALDVRQLVGLTDKNIRWYSDSSNDAGPYALFDSAANADAPDTIWLGARNGVGGTDEFLLQLEPDTLYDVWMDVNNRSIEDGDLFSIHIATSDGGARQTVVDGYVSNRDPAGQVDLGPTTPDLDKLFLTTDLETTDLQFDDFYLSSDGLNATIPRPPGFAGEEESGEIEVGIALADGQVTISFEEGTLQSAPSVDGPWTAVEGAEPPAHTVTPDGAAAFYRAAQ
jgi:hypothetical protein